MRRFRLIPVLALLAALSAGLLFPASARACGTVHNFAYLYFTAENDCCRAKALDHMLCLTPLPYRYYGTEGAQELMRLVLSDALRSRDPNVRLTAEKVLAFYLPMDRFGYLDQVRSYEPTEEDRKRLDELLANEKRFAYLDSLCRECGQ